MLPVSQRFRLTHRCPREVTVMLLLFICCSIWHWTYTECNAMYALQFRNGAQDNVVRPSWSPPCNGQTLFWGISSPHWLDIFPAGMFCTHARVLANACIGAGTRTHAHTHARPYKRKRRPTDNNLYWLHTICHVTNINNVRPVKTCDQCTQFEKINYQNYV